MALFIVKKKIHGMQFPLTKVQAVESLISLPYIKGILVYSVTFLKVVKSFIFIWIYTA